LHHVVGNHVAQRPSFVKVSSPLFHSHRFGVRDLHVVDVATIPDWFKDGIVEAENHDVLHGLLAQVVIDR
jgi:hypothetical protein